MTFEGRSMTYRELDEAANRLAHLLVGQGAGPGQCVALLFSVRRCDRGDVGSAQDRGGVYADRPGVAGGANKSHARRCCPDRRDHHLRRCGRGWTHASQLVIDIEDAALRLFGAELAGAGPPMTSLT